MNDSLLKIVLVVVLVLATIAKNRGRRGGRVRSCSPILIAAQHLGRGLPIKPPALGYDSGRCRYVGWRPGRQLPSWPPRREPSPPSHTSVPREPPVPVPAPVPPAPSHTQSPHPPGNRTGS